MGNRAPGMSREQAFLRAFANLAGQTQHVRSDSRVVSGDVLLVWRDMIAESAYMRLLDRAAGGA